jgi:F0F1-type ATP synthase assembly protein I
MSLPEKDQKYRLQSNANLSAAGLAGQLGCVIPAIIVVAVLGGVWLDKYFDTGHALTILFLVASLPLSIFLTFKMAMRAVKNINETMKPPASPQPSQPKEDETGDQ